MATRLVGVTGWRGVATATRLVLAEPQHSRQVWLVSLPAAQPLGDWDVLLDAVTGAELSRENRMFFSWTGKGSAFRHHPLVSSVTVEPFPYLVRNDLTGDFVYMVNADGDEATSAASIYIFDPQDTHFDEANVYYHLNRMHDFFAGFGFTLLDFTMRADVHFRHKYDNAFFSPKTNSLAFGDGDLMNDFAQEEAIIYHEYSHAMLHFRHPILNYKESGAIHEGQADYFACSFSDDPRIGEWLSAKGLATVTRDLRSPVHYPEDIHDEVHADGLIWGCALWDLRGQLGASVTDRLIYESFAWLKSETPTFMDGLLAILLADENTNQGRNREVITRVFSARGLTAPTRGQTRLTAADLQARKRFDALHEAGSR